ncbi:MAG: AzlC family ABC transporter permease [Solobacterium sp.]|nr:AzlC family ABC transporter permease [Solobacterium sp.]
MKRSWFQSKAFQEGARDGLPIGIGYFAVSFALGIAMRNVGMNWFQGMVMSLLNNASAGEYAGIAMIGAHALYIETAFMVMIANARYFLMSCALSQKISPKTSLFHRILIGFDITDELFGLAIAKKGYVEPSYYYGAMSVSIPGWAIGTALGIVLGNILPTRIVQALSVALFGMFLAVIIPQAKKDSVVFIFILLSFLLSYLCTLLPMLAGISEGTKTIVLTVLLASLAAVIRPHKEETNE